MTSTIAFLALWALVALLYWQRHEPSGAGSWLVMLASTGAAAAFLAILVFLVRRRVRR